MPLFSIFSSLKIYLCSRSSLRQHGQCFIAEFTASGWRRKAQGEHEELPGFQYQQDQVMVRMRQTEQPQDASVQPSSIAPWDHKKCALICRTTEKFSQGGVTLPEPFPFLLWKCLEREERNENCLLMTVQASVALGNMGLMQLQLYCCLLTKSKEGLGSKNGQKEERTPSQEQSSFPFYNHNLQSQNNWELIVGGRHSCLHIHEPLLSGKT